MRAAALLLSVMLTACAAWQPTTPAESIGAAYATITAVSHTAQERLSAGAITVAQAERISARLHAANEAADLATATLATDPKAAEGALAAAHAILSALEQELQP
jgi:hypothetical protein